MIFRKRNPLLMVILVFGLAACASGRPNNPSTQQLVSECARIADRGERQRCLDTAYRTGGRPQQAAGYEAPPEPVVAVESTGMTESELENFASRYAAAWSSQDPVQLASFYAPDGRLQVNDGEPAIGRAEIAAKVAAFMEGFPDMIVRLVRLEYAGERVRFHWHWTGTNIGPGGTGKAVDLRGFEEWTLAPGGQILQSLGHYDDADYARQVGE